MQKNDKFMKMSNKKVNTYIWNMQKFQEVFLKRRFKKRDKTLKKTSKMRKEEDLSEKKTTGFFLRLQGSREKHFQKRIVKHLEMCLNMEGKSEKARMEFCVRKDDTKISE